MANTRNARWEISPPREQSLSIHTELITDVEATGDPYSVEPILKFMKSKFLEDLPDGLEDMIWIWFGDAFEECDTSRHRLGMTWTCCWKGPTTSMMTHARIEYELDMVLILFPLAWIRVDQDLNTMQKWVAHDLEPIWTWCGHCLAVMWKWFGNALHMTWTWLEHD